MKSFKKLAILGIICLSNIVLSPVFAANTAKVTAETARMRSKADSNSKIVTLISMNEEVTILEKSGDWYKVKYDGNTGYMSKTVLDVEKENNTTSETETNTENKKEDEEKNKENEQNTTENNTSDTDTINIVENFEGKTNKKVEINILPLINSSKIATIDENTQIQVEEIINNWCSVKTDSSYGWILISQLEDVIETVKEESSDDENNTEEDKEENTTEESESTEQDTTDEDNKEESKKQEQTEQKTTQQQTTITKGYVNVNTVNVRKEKSITSNILTNLTQNTEVQILGMEDNWYKVKVNGTEGYIASKYISDKKIEITSRSLDSTRQPATESNTTATTTTSNNTVKTPTTSSNTSTSSNSGTDVVNYAKKYLGCKYVSGGMSPTTGFDCSGFTSYVYKHFGKTLSRTSSAQRSNGTEVSKANLQPGDIVCFTGHVGIYIGENKFIHAANAKKGVTITSLSDSYYKKNYITARRIK